MERVSARVRERSALPKSTRGGSAAPAADHPHCYNVEKESGARKVRSCRERAGSKVGSAVDDNRRMKGWTALLLSPKR